MTDMSYAQPAVGSPVLRDRDRKNPNPYPITGGSSGLVRARLPMQACLLSSSFKLQNGTDRRRVLPSRTPRWPSRRLPGTSRPHMWALDIHHRLP